MVPFLASIKRETIENRVLVPFLAVIDSGGDSRLTGRGITHSRDLCGRGAARAGNAQGTPTQSHMPPRILVYEDGWGWGADRVKRETIENRV